MKALLARSLLFAIAAAEIHEVPWTGSKIFSVDSGSTEAMISGKTDWTRSPIDSSIITSKLSIEIKALNESFYVVSNTFLSQFKVLLVVESSQTGKESELLHLVLSNKEMAMA